MTAINTQILADASSAREGSQYLKQLSAANRDAATAVHQARSTSEAEWEGAAANAFRDETQRSSSDTDELARITDKIARALDSFADNIATCVSRMDQAYQLAQSAGLSVRGWWIEKPLGEPVQTASEGAGRPSLPGLDPGYQKQKELERKLDAWSEAVGLVEWARRLERTAHEELNAALSDANNLVASLTKASTWIGNFVALVGSLHGAATKLQGMAAERLAFLEEFKRLSADSAMPAATRQAHLTQMMSSIGLTQQQAESNARALGNLGNTKAGALVFNPLTKTFGGTKPGVMRGLGRWGSVPGFILTGVEAGRQIIFDGKPVGKTLQSNFESWGVGAVAAGVAGAGAVAVGAAAAPAVILGVGVGAAASWAWSYSENNTWEDFQHDSEETGKEVLNRHSEAQEEMRKVEQKHPGSVPSSKW
ncbi:hypothetical protein E1202_04375 [Saccharopolyspora karakumensis]|uniref:Proteins of 100 residues with WXG n=1 Tax=Saccharopolyspora karakumensis TaxID=2530386 RepID=A0A4R5C4Y1_9PSEU|nr:hypothetical protein [Saccharopolyspora karakumensis]TDD91974.1 hypothetical protein E1202_04375 [Saccharopolyspora karakumensis]